jgi:hypothetical protein
MENKILLEQLKNIPGLKINKHQKNELYNVEFIYRKPHHR